MFSGLLSLTKSFFLQRNIAWHKTMSQVRISSPLFTRRGPWPKTSIKEYTAAPGDINNLKLNLGLEENSISVSALMVFHDASEAVNIELNIPASAWRWEKGGETKNVSEWLDASPFWKVTMDGNVLAPDQVQKLNGLKRGLSVRMVLLPTNTKTCSAQVIYYPASKAALKELTEKRQIREGSLAIPVGRLAYGKHQVCLYPFFPVEEDQGVGFGVLPLLEMVSGRDADPKVPSRDQLEEELCELLGNSTVLPKVHDSPEELFAAMKEKTWSIKTMEKPLYWPSYIEPTETEGVADTGNYGNIICMSVSQSVCLKS